MKALSSMKCYLSIFENSEFVWEMTKRELKELNKGAFLGWLWLFISPLIQVGAYVLIVSFVFKSRLEENAGPLDYAIYVLSGMIPWQIIMRSLQQAPMLIRGKTELVKQVIYPIETLPFNSIFVSSFGSLVSFGIFFVLMIITDNLKLSIICLPIPLLLLLIFLLGVSWMFSIIGVIIKDLREIVSIFLNLLVYVSPVIASETMIGPTAWKIILWNPLAHIVICFRDIFNSSFHPTSWLIFSGMSLVFFLIGGWMVTRTKVMINEYI